MKTIYNTYVLMENQNQCNRMKQICIDKNLPVWLPEISFEFYDKSDKNIFCFSPEPNYGFFANYSVKEENQTQVTETEWIDLVNLLDSTN